MAGQPRVRLYRELLTVALHRRFTRAAGLTLLICYLEAIAIGDKSSCKFLPPMYIQRLIRYFSLMDMVSSGAYRDTNASALYVMPFNIYPTGCSASLWGYNHNIAIYHV